MRFLTFWQRGCCRITSTAPQTAGFPASRCDHIMSITQLSMDSSHVKLKLLPNNIDVMGCWNPISFVESILVTVGLSDFTVKTTFRVLLKRGPRVFVVESILITGGLFDLQTDFKVFLKRGPRVFVVESILVSVGLFGLLCKLECF